MNPFELLPCPDSPAWKTIAEWATAWIIVQVLLLYITAMMNSWMKEKMKTLDAGMCPSCKRKFSDRN